jgi:hypothetical protein
MSSKSKYRLILVILVFTYFIIFPNDLPAIFAPAGEAFREVVLIIRDILSLTNMVSPWFYGVLAFGVIAWALVRCFGQTREVVVK